MSNKGRSVKLHGRFKPVNSAIELNLVMRRGNAPFCCARRTVLLKGGRPALRSSWGYQLVGLRNVGSRSLTRLLACLDIR